jgi:hypothetical protein
MATNNTSKNIKLFNCKECDFICCKKGDYNRHILTRKHKLATNSNSFYIEKTSYICENCNKEYQDRTGLWRHKKSCLSHQVQYTPSDLDKNNMNNITNEFQLDKELLIKMLLKNQDVMEKLAEVMPIMMEIMPKLGNQSNNNNNTNSLNTTNNQFNIQMFLNEHCKNAMNLSDFIDSLPITAETYDHTIQNGLTKTITNMITNGLNKLDILERPIHCTDATRKTLYVKEANNWEKDTELLRILLGIRNLARKQRTMINEWKDVNEGWEKDDNIQTKLTTLICHSMTDIENDQKETSKIIRSISKNVYLDNETKQQYLN